MTQLLALVMGAAVPVIFGLIGYLDQNPTNTNPAAVPATERIDR